MSEVYVHEDGQETTKRVSLLTMSAALLIALVKRARVTIGSVTLRGGARRIRSSTGSTPSD